MTPSCPAACMVDCLAPYVCPFVGVSWSSSNPSGDKFSNCLVPPPFVFETDLRAGRPEAGQAARRPRASAPPTTRDRRSTLATPDDVMRRIMSAAAVSVIHTSSAAESAAAAADADAQASAML